MNDNEYAEHASAGSGGDPIGTYTHLPLSYQALYLSDQEAFHDYAFVVLEDDEAAEEAVHTAMTRVRDNWEAAHRDVDTTPPGSTGPSVRRPRPSLPP
ncbi:hypothetical protein [Streptomyces werraensis]|uniref:hypothetical protein n=1 Tax=Streptomyces werraensis TaxID=68284 RepID=UPI0034200923